ncbi:hypothetical protein FHETE_2180 [Fusarium heterosporum]|uniref:Uncharacterized protein n=1 Tax=Fusarium heterosporum TaxID=42747 RepID=A0A8H5TQ33_FUSHE|nr:hypothetical protein FHETE_2180 [Fusarium heterosporum]
MPPAIILDSDDEDDDLGYSPPRTVQAPFSPAPAQAEGEADADAKAYSANDSFGYISRATTSTDPSFFQNIYNEQNDAARGYVPEPTARSHDQDFSVSSSDMTAPAPFKRTVTGLIEPSSFPSQRDRPRKEERMPNKDGQKGPDEWTQASTPGRRKAPTAIMDDLWDVPSSPERPVRPKIKIKLKRSGAQSDSTSESRELDEVAMVSDSRSERPVDLISSKTKRRKIDHPEPSFQGSDEVNLVTMPFSHDHEGDDRDYQPAPTPSMLPPTMPVNEEASFLIAPNPLIDAQKLEYESLHLPSSGSPYHQLPPVRQFEIQNLASSGDATNVNTPRPNATYLMSTAPPPSSIVDPPRAAIGQSNRHRWDSSPDVIAAIDSPPREKATRRQEQPSQNDVSEPTDGEVMEAQQIEQVKLPIIQETPPNNYEHEMAAKPAKAKKSRGRPKKKTTEDDVPLINSLPTQLEVTEPATNGKKKRGRPRKSEQNDTKEESLKVYESLSANDASLSEESMRPEKKTKSGIEEIEDRDELAEEDNIQPSSKSNSCESFALKDSDLNVPTKSVCNADDNEGSNFSDATNRAEKKQKPEKPAVSSKGSTPSKGLSATINKPVYRVGLSKRSRIAPLLKCLRKE